MLSTSLLALNAHDFTATTANGQKLYFNIISNVHKQVELTYQGTIASNVSSPYKGDITLPATVKHNNIVYKVIGIRSKSFSNATSLQSIVLPEDLQCIGDFAFEGCTALQSVVFSGNEPKMGQGIFFRCVALKQITLGSDWKQVNLQMFRWSKQLTHLYIPAKMKRIQNLKWLRNLQSIEIDINNTNFCSIDGMLYDKACTTLLGCPRGAKGKIKVAEGVRNIYWGALADCLSITDIDLPSSLQTLSFREFARLKQLKSITMRAESPITTAATLDGKRVFILQIAKGNAPMLLVPRHALKEYKANIVSTDGEYTEIGKNCHKGISLDDALLPICLETDRMLNKRNIKKYKS